MGRSKLIKSSLFAALFFGIFLTDSNPGWGWGEKLVYKGSLGSVTEGLVGYWDFNEGEGDIAYDESPFANDGILVNEPTWILGAANGALRFDGVDDYVECSGGPSLSDLSATFTITFRMRTQGTGQSEYILYKGGLTKGFYFRTHVDDTLLFKLDDGTNEVYRSSNNTAPTDGEWHFIAARVIGRTSMELYVDGVLQTLGWMDLSLVGDITNTDQLTLAGTTVDPNAHYRGDLDDIRIYNRVLGVTEILTILNDWVPPEEITPTPVPPTGTPTPTPTPDGSGGTPANVYYVRPPGGNYGAEDGSDWNNAFDGIPEDMHRGWTYYLADGTYPGRDLFAPVVGSQTIQIFKATLQNHGTNVGWTPTFGDGAAVFSSQITIWTANWIIDGRERNPDWKTEYGIRIDASGNKGIRIIRDAVDNVTIRYVEFEGRGDDGGASPANDLVYVTADVTGFLLSKCYLHDSGRTFVLLRSGDDGLIEHCYFARNESTAAQHGAGISAYGGTDRWTVRNNIWEDADGTGIVMFAGDGWDVMGNLCFETGTRNIQHGNGSVATWSGYLVTNSRVVNNTFARISGASGLRFGHDVGAFGNLGYNNLWYECPNISFSGLIHVFNAFYDSQNKSEPNGQYTSGDPFVDSENFDFNLAGPTDPGLDVPEFPFQIDIEDRIRGADGVWDRGAMELGDIYSGGGGAGGLFFDVREWGLYE
jgi:hypothetical protein